MTAQEIPAQRVGWLDFEREPDMTGDGSGDENTWYLTIADGLGTSSWPEEIAVICHRTVDGKYPIDGDLANQKRRNAQVICDALNDGHAERLWGDPPKSPWPETDAERVRFVDWQHDVGEGNTNLGFREWLTAERGEKCDTCGDAVTREGDELVGSDGSVTCPLSDRPHGPAVPDQEGE